MPRSALIFLLAASPPLRAQESKPVGGAQASTWLMYFGDHPISGKASLHLEGQFRREGAGQRWEQLVLRPGFGYALPHGFTTLFAYTYLQDHPFEGGSLGSSRPGAPTTGPQPEHRILEQLSFKHRLGPESLHTPNLTHRFRNEQRFEGTATEGVGVTNWDFAERARYRLTADTPLNRGVKTLYPNYISIYNEVFADYGPHATRKLDQDRTYGAFGWTLGSTLQLELGYLYQYSPKPNGIVGVGNNAVQITINSTAPFRKGLIPKTKK